MPGSCVDGELVRGPRFSDAGFAHQQRDAPPAALGLRESFIQLRDFALTADEDLSQPMWGRCQSRRNVTFSRFVQYITPLGRLRAVLYAAASNIASSRVILMVRQNHRLPWPAAAPEEHLMKSADSRG
jgi:hypothetical protein